MEENIFLTKLSKAIKDEKIPGAQVCYTYQKNNYVAFGKTNEFETAMVFTCMDSVGPIDVYKISGNLNDKDGRTELYSSFLIRFLEKTYENELTGYVLFRQVDRSICNYTEKPRDALAKNLKENHQFISFNDNVFFMFKNSSTKWSAISKHKRGFEEVKKIVSLNKNINKDNRLKDVSGVFSSAISSLGLEVEIKMHYENENYTLYIQNTNPVSFRINYSFSNLDMVPIVFDDPESDIVAHLVEFELQNRLYKLVAEES